MAQRFFMLSFQLELLSMQRKISNQPITSTLLCSLCAFVAFALHRATLHVPRCVRLKPAWETADDVAALLRTPATELPSPR